MVGSQTFDQPLTSSEGDYGLFRNVRCDRRFAIERPQELQREDQQHDRRVRDPHPLIEIGTFEAVAPRKASGPQLLFRPQHVWRRIEPHELDFDIGRQLRTNREK